MFVDTKLPRNLIEVSHVHLKCDYYGVSPCSLIMGPSLQGHDHPSTTQGEGCTVQGHCFSCNQALLESHSRAVP